MLRRIALRKFRSIESAELSLHPSGLTVLVGANGCGKSNVVRALGLLASAGRDGMEAALYAAGGAEALIPKNVPAKDLARQKIEIDADFDLPEPEMFPAGRANPTAQMELAIKWSRSGAPIIAKERYTFGDALSIGRFAPLEELTPEELEAIRPPPPSEVTIRRGKKKRMYFDFSPTLTQHTLEDYRTWLGLSPFPRGVNSAREVRDLLRYVSDEFGYCAEDGPQNAAWLLEPAMRGLLTRSHGTFELRKWTTRLRRFDLQVSELRKEQRAGFALRLEPDGTNLPAMIRRLQTDGHEKNWARICETLDEIAPHVGSVCAKELRAGKEFVGFEERTGRRLVESWNSSDGTLRALALLVAVESQPNRSLIAIEEPELGLHPWAVRALMRHFREVAENNAVQIVLTTHSPQVLEEMHPKEVHVASRSSEGGTEFARADTLLADGRRLTRGDLSRLWVKGLLGGVPRIADV